MKKSERGHGKL